MKLNKHNPKNFVAVIGTCDYDGHCFVPNGDVVTTFFGEVMDNNNTRVFADIKHLRNFVRKVFNGSVVAEWEISECGTMVWASIIDRDDYDYWVNLRTW